MSHRDTADLTVRSGLEREDDTAAASGERGMQQPKRMADVAVVGRLRRPRRRSAEPVRGVIVVNERDAVFGIVAPRVSPVEGTATGQKRKCRGESACQQAMPDVSKR